MRRVLVGLLSLPISAILFVLSLPPAGWWPLGWIAFVPVLAAVRRTRFIVGFLAGIGTALLSAVGAVSGVLYRNPSPGGEPHWIYLGFFLFGCALSVVAGVAAESKEIKRLGVLALAALAVLLEASLQVILPATHALSQSRVPAMLQLASVTGIWGVSFVLWVSNLGIAEAVRRRQIQALRPALPVAAIVVLGFFLWNDGSSSRSAIPVKMVQSESEDLEELRRLSGEGDGIAVWREFGGQMHAPRGDTKALQEVSAKSGVPAILTSYQDGYEPLPHNTAAMFYRGKVSQPYFKRRLFGAESKMHTPGTAPAAAERDPGGSRVGMNICFDTCFPSIIRDTANLDRVELIAVPTIDPASPHQFLAAIHAAYTPFRAVENGVSVVRVDGNAFSMAVDASGRVVSEMGIGQESRGVMVPTARRWTLYRWLGDWFLFACAAVLVAWISERIRRARGAERAREASFTESLSREPLLPETDRRPTESLSQG